MPSIDEILTKELTAPQKAAATDISREVIALACAGSGKSRTLAYRVAWLIAEKGADPKSIVGFTFTEKAADSMKRQVAIALRKCGVDPLVLGAMYIGTIHSYCYNLLAQMDARYRQFDVLDENRLKLYLISRYYDLELNALQAAKNVNYFPTVREVSNAWKTMNDELLSITDITTHDPLIGATLARLRARLNSDNYIDFSLMIRLVVDALQQGNREAWATLSGLRHLMVDEYQDVNPSQEMLINLMHGVSETLFVVGDDDQAIYAWRGADVGNILSFRQRFPAASPHTLEFNFRSTPAIVQAADGFIRAELGPTRITKNPQAQNPPGTRDFRRLWFNDRTDEARWIAERIQSLLGTAYHETDGRVRGLTPGDFAILMRSTGGTSGPPHHVAFTEQLEAAGITFALESGGGLFDRLHVAAMRGSFELLRRQSPTREIALSFFNTEVLPHFPQANFTDFAEVLMEWGRRIHSPITGHRRRVYLQQFVHDLLGALRFQQSNFDEGILYAIGVFSRIIQDVETVYVSVDTATRFREVLNFLGNVADSGYELSTQDLLVRPDAVMVSTVHKVKGLEYPVVFVADAENQRFPLGERGYFGWLPRPVLAPALSRGRYQRTGTEEARLFYTAVTRAERYLYVTGSAHLPGGVQQRKQSNFSLRLNHAELSEDAQALPIGLIQCARVRRIDEALLPTTFSDIRYYLRCPADYNMRKRLGFSPPIKEMFGFGQTIHAVIGRLHQVCKNQAPSEAEMMQIADGTFHLKHVPQSGNPTTAPGPYERAKEKAAKVVKDYVNGYAADFATGRQVEIRFEVPLDKAVIAGTIDLILNCDAGGQITGSTVIDFKTLAAGEAPEENEEMDWTELSLQVQLYAKAANEVLGQNARTGAVHFLKDGQRIQVPVNDDAINAAVENVEWAVDRILNQDFPMRPHMGKCQECDFNQLCSKLPEQFRVASIPPPIHLPGSVMKVARAFSEYQP